jgi:hypothetical protein
MNENQMVCLKCGVMSGTGKSFCPNCGNAVSPEAVVCVNCGVALGEENHEASASNVNSESARKIQKRDLVKAIILSIVTCGIYSIYWFISFYIFGIGSFFAAICKSRKTNSCKSLEK